MIGSWYETVCITSSLGKIVAVVELVQEQIRPVAGDEIANARQVRAASQHAALRLHRRRESDDPTDSQERGKRGQSVLGLLKISNLLNNAALQGVISRYRAEAVT